MIDIYNDGYIGITNDVPRRIKEHKGNKKSKIRHHILRGANITIIARHLYKHEAEILEKKLRPTERIGWNIIPGGSTPPSRKGKTSQKSLLKGPDRTDRQKECAKTHSMFMSGRKRPNGREISMFGITFRTYAEAMKHLSLSTSTFYIYKKYLEAGNSPFLSKEQLLEFIQRQKSEKIKEKIKKRKGGPDIDVLEWKNNIRAAHNSKIKVCCIKCKKEMTITGLTQHTNSHKGN